MGLIIRKRTPLSGRIAPDGLDLDDVSSVVGE